MPDTAVNAQITDAVTQANVKVLGDAPALALGSLYQIVSQSLGLSADNATFGPQQQNVIHQATTTQGVSLLSSIDTAATGVATETIAREDAPAGLASILAAVGRSTP